MVPRGPAGTATGTSVRRQSRRFWAKRIRCSRHSWCCVPPIWVEPIRDRARDGTGPANCHDQTAELRRPIRGSSTSWSRQRGITSNGMPTTASRPTTAGLKPDPTDTRHTHRPHRPGDHLRARVHAEPTPRPPRTRHRNPTPAASRRCVHRTRPGDLPARQRICLPPIRQRNGATREEDGYVADPDFEENLAAWFAREWSRRPNVAGRGWWPSGRHDELGDLRADATARACAKPLGISRQRIRTRGIPQSGYRQPARQRSVELRR